MPKVIIKELAHIFKVFMAYTTDINIKNKECAHENFTFANMQFVDI